MKLLRFLKSVIVDLYNKSIGYFITFILALLIAIGAVIVCFTIPILITIFWIHTDNINVIYGVFIIEAIIFGICMERENIINYFKTTWKKSSKL